MSSELVASPNAVANAGDIDVGRNSPGKAAAVEDGELAEIMSQDDTQGLTPLRDIDSLYSNAVYRACESIIEQIGVSSQQILHSLLRRIGQKSSGLIQSKDSELYRLSIKIVLNYIGFLEMKKKHQEEYITKLHQQNKTLQSLQDYVGQLKATELHLLDELNLAKKTIDQKDFLISKLKDTDGEPRKKRKAVSALENSCNEPGKDARELE